MSDINDLTTINEDDFSKLGPISSHINFNDYFIEPSIFVDRTFGLVDGIYDDNNSTIDTHNISDKIVESLLSAPESFPDSEIKCKKGEKRQLDEPTSTCMRKRNGRTSNKKKKYELEPFSDDDDEKKRLNAKKAFENRKRNKELSQEREHEIEILKKENCDLKSENKIWESKEKMFNELKDQWEKERTFYRELLLRSTDIKQIVIEPNQ